MPRDKSQHPPFDPSRAAWLVAILMGILALAHLAASFVPGVSTWGIDYWSCIPVAWRLVLLGLLGFVIFSPAAQRIGSMADWLARKRWRGALCLLALGVLFVVFRSRVYVYGDGYSFAGYFAGGAFPRLTGQLSSQALDLAAHWAVYRWIVMPMGGSVETSYVILGPIAGLLGVWAIVRIARALGSELATRRLLVAAGLSGAAVALWFGYVESYALVNAGILWSIALAIEAQDHRRRIWAAWIVWIVSVGFHQLAVVLAPAMLWAHWRIHHPKTKSMNNWVRAGLVAAGFVGWLGATVAYSLVKPDVFVPLFRTANSTYTAFSWAHLRDSVNLLLFLAPMGAIGIVLWLRGRDTESAGRQAGHSVIAVAAASLWYFAFWVDPLLGAFRDWDLLAGFGIPLSIWGGSIIAQRVSRRPAGAHIWIATGAFALIHAGIFVGTLQSPEKSMLRLDGMVREDVHYSNNFFSGKRLGPWALVLQIRFDRNDMAIEHLRRQVSYAPNDGQVWGNLGGAYRLAKQVDSAIACFKQAVIHEPKILKYRYNLGRAQLETGDYNGAHEQFLQAVAIADTAYECRCLLGVTCLRMLRADEAGQVLDEAIRRNPTRYDAYYYRGAQREMLFDTAGAIRDYESALERGGRVQEVFARLGQIYQWTKTPEKAIPIARAWEQTYPSAFEAPFMAGTTYLVLKQYDSAVATLSRAVRLQPENALATYYLATAYRNLQRPERAKELAIAASRMDTTLALPHLELVYLAADAGDRAAAAAATREYLRRSPKDSAMGYLQQFLGP